jgi:hypothetical protein|tara:strand:- start:795 stop:1262 length:468 start_codon:yes stop_codon:yes gene_type:complete
VYHVIQSLLDLAQTARRSAPHHYRRADLGFFPAGVLAAYWVGGEPALIGAAVLMPILFIDVGGFSQREFNVALLQRSTKTLLQRDIFTEFDERTYAQTSDRTTGSALFQIQINDYQSLVDRHGQTAVDTVINVLASGLFCKCVIKIKSRAWGIAT